MQTKWIISRQHFICIGSAYLSLSVDANDSAGGFMRSSYKDCVATDSVHVDACSGLNVVQVNITVFGDEIDYVILRANLQWSVIFVNELKNYDKRIHQHKILDERNAFDGLPA